MNDLAKYVKVSYKERHAATLPAQMYNTVTI